MKVPLLENAIDRFLKSALIQDDTSWYYPHSLVTGFSTHWGAPDTQSLLSIYDDCLQSEFSQRWWKRDNYKPKEIMLRLIEADPELAAIAWKDLANPSASLEGRLSRFEFYCSDLRQRHRQKNPRSVESYHHQDAAILSLYLAGLFPDIYTLYPGLDLFQSFCKAVGSPDIPKVEDLARYMKVASIVFKFLGQNDKYSKLLMHRDPDIHKIRVIPMQISYEIILSEGERYKKTGKP